jgi:diguanylate cyclase (GGDEF)-like protein
MHDCLTDELNRIIAKEDIATLLQPIIDVEKRKVFGYEALSRGPSDSPLHPAQMLFETAERCGLTLELETLCLRTAAASWSEQGNPNKLFVNLSPAKLLPPEFRPDQLQKLLKTNGLQAKDIVIELSERYPTADPAELLKTLSWLKDEGFLIAIDDLGSGYSGLKLWSELKPDFVKIDRHFIRDIQDDLVKREFLRSVVELADRIGCKLIAEGVETDAEFRVVSGLGISLVQGFLFGRPRPIASACLDPLGLKESSEADTLSRDTAGPLCTFIEPVGPGATLHHAWERLQSEPGMFALPVVESGRPLGLIHKWRLLEIFSTPYGRALYERRSVTRILSSDAVVVEYTMSIEQLSQRLVNEDAHYLKQHFIVVKEGRYVGLGATRTLLQRITDTKIENARYSNPLTLLPGNVPIQKALAARTGTGQAFYLVYFDINMFKPLNDLLGYRVGDQAILLMREILLRLFDAASDFVGHIGGDDFVVISEKPDIRELVAKVQDQFCSESRRFYSDRTLAKGYVESEDRSGRRIRFPLVSLSAGVVEVPENDPRTPELLADTASYAKKKAKVSGDHCHFEYCASYSPQPVCCSTM